MSTSAKDVPNSELVPEQSELQLADVKIDELERELQSAQEEIARLKAALESSRPPSPPR